MTSTDDQAHTAGPNNATHPRQAPRPQTPASTTTERMIADDEGTLYAPISLSMIGSAYIDGACPMSYEVTDDDAVSLLFGDPKLATLRLVISDHALISIVHLTISALRAMQARDKRRQTPAPAIPERTVGDDQGTASAPALVSMDGNTFIDDNCPMSYALDAEENDDGDAYLEFGDLNLILTLVIHRPALINMVRLTISAASAMLQARGMPAGPGGRPRT